MNILSSSSSPSGQCDLMPLIMQKGNSFSKNRNAESSKAYLALHYVNEHKEINCRWFIETTPPIVYCAHLLELSRNSYSFRYIVDTMLVFFRSSLLVEQGPLPSLTSLSWEKYSLYLLWNQKLVYTVFELFTYTGLVKLVQPLSIPKVIPVRRNAYGYSYFLKLIPSPRW